MAEISVPVKLQIENLQSLVNELQSKLSNLKVGSAGFKAIQSIITSIRGEMDKLSIQTSKPFMDASQFTKAENSVEKLEDQIEKVQLAISRIKFSDLELTPGQQADLKAFEDSINSIKDKIKTIKNTAKDEFLNSPLGQEWLKIDETAFSKSLNQITNNIRKAVSDQKAALQDLQQTELSYQHAIEENQRIEAFFKKNGKSPFADSSASMATLGKDLYDKIFTTKANGQWAFKTGGKNLLSEWLEQELKLDESTLNSIINKNVSAAQLGQKLKDVLNGQLQTNNKFTNNNSNITANTAEAQAQYNGLIDILHQVGASEEQVAAAEQILKASLSDTTNAWTQYKDQLVEAARGNTDVQNTTNAMKSQLENFKITLASTNSQFLKLQKVQQSFNQMKIAIVNFMGFTQVLNLTKRAIKEAINHIKELDTVMNKISIVTDMSTGDLWDQVEQYSKMAQNYGATIKGAYEVSQIYYQQGLGTNDVLTLTNETLKLAKISGLDYAQTTDYMTTALRGFKMEMSEASTVVDVYSNLAAHTAVSSEELAVAMSKTASSMESVGSTFEETSAMIGTMVAVTRESATNIGSALKSIASRYGEMKKDPLTLVDAEGDEIAYNKVDAALQSIGISLKTTDGQFRSFTDVIVELSEKWDQLESTQQRYIATQFAGNRQQSRFLALVSNPELLKANINYAEESEDTGTLQALKALDSIESKMNQVQVAYQQFYTTIGFEDVWKGFLDGAKNVVNTLNRMPKLFGTLPIAALNAISNAVVILKSLGMKLLATVAKGFGTGFVNGIKEALPQAQSGATELADTVIKTISSKVSEMKSVGQSYGQALNEGLTIGAFKQDANLNLPQNQRSQLLDLSKTALSSKVTPAEQQVARETIANQLRDANILTANGFKELTTNGSQAEAIILRVQTALGIEAAEAERARQKNENLGNGIASFGMALNMVATVIDTTSQGGKQLSGALQAVAGAAMIAGSAIKAMNAEGHKIPWVAIASGVIALISGISQIIQSTSIEARLEEATAKAEEFSNKAKELKANFRTYDTSITKLKKLEEARYDSAEAAQEYQDAVDDLVSKFPELISGFDDAGNAIINAVAMENSLTDARLAAAEATYKAAQAEADAAKLKIEQKQAEISTKGEKISNSTLSTQREDGYSAGVYIAKDQNNNSVYTKTNHSNSIISYLTNSNNKLIYEQQQLLSWIKQNNLESSENTTIITSLLTKLGNQAQLGNYDEVAKLNSYLQLAYRTAGWTMTDDIQKNVKELDQLITEVQPIYNQLVSWNKESVNSWIRSSRFRDLPIISESNGLFSFAQQQIYDLANGDFSETNLAFKGEEILEPLNLLWTKLSENTREQVNNIVNHPEQYTSADLKQVFEDAKISESLIPDWIYNTFKNQNETIRAALQNKANLVFTDVQKNTEEYREFLSTIADVNTEFTLNEQKFLTSALEQITSINESGFDATNFIESINTISSQIRELSTEARNALLNQILTNGFSAEGWKKTLDYIVNNTDYNFSSIDKNAIDTIINRTIPNYQLSADSAIGEIEEKWEDLDKLFSKIQKGVSKPELSSVVTQAKSLGIDTFDEYDFVSDAENMILNAETLETVIGNYKINLQSNIQGLIDDLNDTYDLISESETPLFSGDGATLNDQFKLLEKYQRILGSDFNDYFKQDDKGQWMAILEEGETLEDAQARISDAIEQHYINGKSALDNVLQYYDIVFTNLVKSLSWKRGDYSSLINTGLYEDQEAVNTRLLQLAVDIGELSEEELLQPDVKNAVTQVQEAYNNLISDVLSKGFGEIKFKDYEGLIGITADDITGSYESFILKYGQYTGQTIQDLNNNFLDAIEKDNAKTSNDAIKDLQFISQTQFKTNRSGLADLAARFSLDLTDPIIRAAIAYDKQLGEYIVDWVQINDLKEQLPSVEGFSDTVADSINEFFDSLIDLIKKGLTGSLTATGSTQLADYAKTYLQIEKLDFTETAEGLKLSQKSAIELYSALKKVNDIKSSLVFDELSKSLEETNEHYNDISSILARINELDSIAPDARSKEYQQELDLAKEILAVRSTSEDKGFNFMSNKIPGAQNNPLNYWANWQKGYQALEEGIKSGHMDYSDFYNLITEMGNLAEKTNGITIGAGKVLENSKDAADLIEQAAGTLSVDSTGALKVNLNKLAELGIDFSSAGTSMDAGVTDGIKKFAHAQVDMLDSMIAMLETIVAMEQLGDLDIDENGLNIGDLFNIYYDDNGSIIGWDKEFKGAYKDFREEMLHQLTLKKGDEGYNEDLQKGLTETFIGDGEQKFSLAELLNWTPDNFMASANQDIAKLYPALLQAYSDAARSGNFDTDAIWESVKDVLAGTDYTGNIDLGDLHLRVTSGTILERVEGGYKVDDTVYSNEKAAVSAMYAKDISNLAGETKNYTEDGTIEYTGLINAKVTYNTETGYTAQFDDGYSATSDSKEGIELAIATYAQLKNIDIDSANAAPVTFTFTQGVNTSVTYQVQGSTISVIDGEDSLEVSAALSEVINKSNESVPVTINKINATLSDDVEITTTEITIPDINYDKVVNCVISLLTLQKNSDGTFAQDPGDVIPDDLINQEINAVIAALTLIKDKSASGNWQSNGDVKPENLTDENIDALITKLTLKKDTNVEEWQNPGDVVPEDLPESVLTAIISKLQLEWSENATKEPDTEALGIKNEYTAPDAVINQKVAVNWDPEGTGITIGEDGILTLTPNAIEGNPTINVLLDATKAEQNKLKSTIEKVVPHVTPILNKPDTSPITEAVEKLNLTKTVTLKYKDDDSGLSTPGSSGGGGGGGLRDEMINVLGTDPRNIRATGNLGLAKSKGTLMGELGPELVVSKGHYFVAGQSGPEMINLADDAIVFNHLQTKSLLEKGTSKGRGKAITNERKAVAFAQGSMNGGPAKASASAALAALKQLRAQWKALEGLSAKDLASKGGGGGGGNKDAAFIKDLERWYNLLQEIAKLEEKITYEEAKRSKIQSDFNRNGYDYYKSQRDTLKYLEREIAIQQQLADEQQAYFEKRKAELNKQSAFSELYTFDEAGQIKYKSGKFAELSERFGGDSTTNKPNYTIDEQYQWLIDNGYGYAMKYNDSGEEIDVKDAAGKKTAIEAFWSKIEADQNEMQELHNSIEEHKNAVLEKMQAQNEILQEMEDNQVTLENRVLKAIEDSAQREIDELSKQKDAYKESTDAFIKGISDQLSKEQKLYESTQSATDLDKKRRRLAILQRSGGSAAEISSLQAEIDNASRDVYFEKQQQQIDAIQEASDNQIKKLEEQIDLMTEALEYQKANGLLWEEVYKIMALTPEEITTYITDHDSEFWGKSLVGLEQETRQIKFEAEQWKSFTGDGGIQDLVAAIADEVTRETRLAEEARAAEEAKEASAAVNKTSDTSATDTNNKNNTNANTQQDYTKKKYQWMYTYKDKDGYISSRVVDANTLEGAIQLADNASKSAGGKRLNKPTIIKTYDYGGIVDEDQYALVHAKEGVFTPEQTSILRNEILGSSQDSALNILRDIRTAWMDSSRGISSIHNDESSSIVIEHAEVNMKVEKLANDYDAARAGESALREILNVARKTGAQNRVRR